MLVFRGMFSSPTQFQTAQGLVFVLNQPKTQILQGSACKIKKAEAVFLLLPQEVEEC
jgi:hypothetical protein